ncbi:DUF5687 family protein [Roseivirga sp.]|uniref:DUF5687 family protein n=1 Tax=Roseivirga sp. TaxID=1964215 RepID=UPI003B8BF2CE
MIQALLSHSWKEQFRSAVWAKNLVANIFLGFAALMITIYALLLGIFLNEIVEAILPDKDPLTIINSVIIYYAAFEFFIRFFLQNVPVLSIQPYLHLPIKKAKMINFMLRKSLLSPFNILSVLFFAPFAIRIINSSNGTAQAIGWLFFIVGLAFMLHYAIILFKKKLSDHPNLIFYAFIVLAGIGALDYYGIVSLSTISSNMMNMIMETPYLAAIPWLVSVLFYYLNFNFLVNNTYPEEISIKKKETRVSGDFAFLKRFGHKGELMATEIKLILRHKRPRNTVMFSAIFLFYGLIFYPNPQYQDMEFIFVFVGVFITGIFFIQYGQFLLSWDSSFFDFVLIRKSTFKEYIEAKYYLFVLISTIGFVLSLAYGYFGWKIVLINFCAYLFNIGINVFAVMRIAMFNPKKIDLNKRAAFNYEGVGAAQFLIAIPIMILPYLIYGPLAIFGFADLGIILTGAAGLIGFILREKSLNIITKYFIQNKHKIAAGFRAQ